MFDGSLEGLLSAVFEWFERKPGAVLLKTQAHHQPEAFDPVFLVQSDKRKADRVWKGLQKRLDKNWMRKVYCCYLSEIPESYTALFEFACYLFSSSVSITENYGNTEVLYLAQVAKKVEREKHRMEAFIRFQHTTEGLFYCSIEPDFNILPLIMNHFKNRYADQQWIIYDIRRNYGLYYNLQEVEQISMEFNSGMKLGKAPQKALSQTESLYAQLWKDYFKSTNIPARKNTKLHIQHVPRRYWKYLTEKQDTF